MTDVSKSIWAGLVSNTTNVDGVTTMRQQAEASFNSVYGRVNATDIARAASVGVALTNTVPSNIATLTGAVDNAELESTLNDFLQRYTKIRYYTFDQIKTSWANGNGRADVPNYNKKGYEAALAGQTVGTTDPAFAPIESGQAIDRSNYEATTIGTLRTYIDTQANLFGGVINYCHNSCHSNCHSARGRR